MYRDVFQKENNYDFLEMIDIKGTAREILHAYILNINFIYAF